MRLERRVAAERLNAVDGRDAAQSAAPPEGHAAPPADSEWRRLSARMLLVHPVRELVQNIPTLLVLLIAGHSRGDGGGWWSVGGAGLVVAASIARWFTTRYRITPEQVQLRKGLLRRQTITTPADRVRSVDVSASALHRVLGLAKVEIGTGVSDSKKEGLALDGLGTAAAHGLRAELLHRAGTSAASGLVPASPGRETGEDPGVETELSRLRLSWIAYAPFTFSGILTALAVAGVGSRLLGETNLDLSRTAAYQQATGRVDAAPVWIAVLAGLVLVVVGIAVLSLFAYVLAFWGYRLTRHSRGSLHVQRGLVTTRATSIDQRRLRGVEVSEPLLLRAVRGARLIAITTGLRVGRGAQRGGSMIVPPAPVTEVRRVAAAILRLLPSTDGPGIGSPAAPRERPGLSALIDGPLVGHGPRARRRRWLRAVLPGLLLLVAAAGLFRVGWPVWVVAVPLGWLAAAPALATDRYRSLGHVVGGGYLVTRFGSLVRRRSIVATDGIIGWNIDATFFQRRAGLVTLAATTAAGDQAYCVWDVPAAEALAMAERAIPGLLEQFLAPSDG